MTHPRLRPSVAALRPFRAGKSAAELQGVVSLASNENPYGASPRARAAVQESAAHLHLYPDGASTVLKDALSGHLSVDSSQICLGAGSDELIQLLGSILLQAPDDEVVVGDPSFVRYDASALLAGCPLVKVPLDSGWKHDLSAMAGVISDRTRLVFIANPNNPTGTSVSNAELSSFAHDLPAGTTLVVDEAYYEYACAEEGFPDGLDLVREGLNVAVLRTFSKAYGLAGLRIGYAVAGRELIQALESARGPFNVSSCAQEAALAALLDTEWLQKCVSDNQRCRRRLCEGLAQLGWRIVPSAANFVFTDCGGPAAPLAAQLFERGFFVRAGDMFGTPSFLRITVGTWEQTEGLLEAIKACQAVPA